MDESLKRKAYLDGINLKKSGLDNETIYARLEKSGIPPELAEEVVMNIFLQENKSVKSSSRESSNISVIMVVVGFVVAIISGLFFPEALILPSGLIIWGIVGIVKANMNN